MGPHVIRRAINRNWTAADHTKRQLVSVVGKKISRRIDGRFRLEKRSFGTQDQRRCWNIVRCEKSWLGREKNII